MKIGKPTKEIPYSNIGNRNKFNSLYAKIRKMKNGLFLPIEFATKGEAVSFAISARNQGFQSKQRGNTVFVRNKK